MLRVIALTCLAAVVCCPVYPNEPMEEVAECLNSSTSSLQETKHAFYQNNSSGIAGPQWFEYSFHALAEKSQWAAAAMWITRGCPLTMQFKLKLILRMLFQIQLPDTNKANEMDAGHA